MGGPDDWREHTSDAELVDELLRSGTATRPGGPPQPRGADRAADPSRRLRRRLGKALLVCGATTALFTVLYVVDLLVSIGDVPRGVTVAGVDIGGLSRADAEDTLRRELRPLLDAPVEIRAGDAHTTFDPDSAGLDVDFSATVDQAGSQPWDPLTRVVSFFRPREVGVVTVVDEPALREALRELAAHRIDREPADGHIGFRALGDGAVRPYAFEAKAGQRLTDLDAAVAAVRGQWPVADRVNIPVERIRPRLSSAAVHATLEHTVAPLVSGPVRLRGDGADAVLLPDDISEAVRFDVRPGGELGVTLDHTVLRAAVRAELDSTQRQARNAKLVFRDEVPVIEPSVRGTRIDWARTFTGFRQVAGAREGRELTVAYDMVEPEVTTADTEALGVTEIVALATTRGFAADVAPNIRAIARAVDGVLVRPGETFDLEERTGPRTASRGYIVAPLHENGTGPEAIGGGVSQFTTTLYNAVYLAGLGEIRHTPGQTYLPRYPPGRDAVSLTGDGSTVEFSFTNDTSTALVVQTRVSGSSVTVALWGTRHYRVESVTGPKTDVTPPRVVHDDSVDCEPSRGSAGFTVSDTRIRYSADTGDEVDRQTRRVRYAPRPTVVC